MMMTAQTGKMMTTHQQEKPVSTALSSRVKSFELETTNNGPCNIIKDSTAYAKRTNSGNSSSNCSGIRRGCDNNSSSSYKNNSSNNNNNNNNNKSIISRTTTAHYVHFSSRDRHENRAG